MDVEVPVLVIVAGVLPAVARSTAFSPPDWLVENTMSDQEH